LLREFSESSFEKQQQLEKTNKIHFKKVLIYLVPVMAEVWRLIVVRVFHFLVSMILSPPEAPPTASTAPSLSNSRVEGSKAEVS